MIKEDYVSFETAKLLKEKGFDSPCFMAYYETNNGHKIGYDVGRNNYQWDIVNKENGLSNCCAPTLQMAMKWLRKEHNIGIFPSTYCLLKNGEVTHPYGTCITNLVTYEIIVDDCLPEETYEEAIENALIYCLKNLI